MAPADTKPALYNYNTLVYVLKNVIRFKHAMGRNTHLAAMLLPLICKASAEGQQLTSTQSGCDVASGSGCGSGSTSLAFAQPEQVHGAASRVGVGVYSTAVLPFSAYPTLSKVKTKLPPW